MPDGDETKKMFKDLSIHLMPFMQNAYYTRPDIISSQPDSPVSKNEDFYKGADIKKACSLPEIVKTEEKEE